jgi:hypothetical protein
MPRKKTDLTCTVLQQFGAMFRFSDVPCFSQRGPCDVTSITIGGYGVTRAVLKKDIMLKALNGRQNPASSGDVAPRAYPPWHDDFATITL